ncbi:inhibitor of apoptosis protein 2 [Orgyia leucostigma nucleopolyhedrovirus]|uniref:Inhibitor of apoptosis protein 2 n=1 Tax=Orgyia leucostigma nucleopolyhedrovirus TaxID=490711 RepID=B0FDR1_9ABAC|nr:inhibitor of apoptosis protein 2 [Orgyia leucostigma nucleopolyhedrovirus]ABY65769.1 inhibitor of apoptosis protein 2 [Orgyia leucostigma nucleopolyhedrovirus]
MLDESQRLATFALWPHAQPSLARALARHGFYYCPETDTVCCCKCALEYANCDPHLLFGDRVHKRMKCEFANFNVSMLNDNDIINTSLTTNYLCDENDGNTISPLSEAHEPARCGVCLEKERDACLVPCGHLVCSTCGVKLTTCPFCRCENVFLQRIYK